MVVEYSIKFVKDGLTITQRVDSDSQAPPIKGQGAVDQNSLKNTVQASEAANAANPSLATGTNTTTSGKGGGPVAPPNNTGGGPVGLSSGPVTIIGPFIFLCPPHKHDKDEPEVSHGK